MGSPIVGRREVSDSIVTPMAVGWSSITIMVGIRFPLGPWGRSSKPRVGLKQISSGWDSSSRRVALWTAGKGVRFFCLGTALPAKPGAFAVAAVTAAIRD